MTKVVGAGLVAFVAIAVFWLWPGGGPSGSPNKLLLSGETAMVPLMEELAREFQRSHPSVQIELTSGHSSNGVEDVRSGAAMVGMILDDQVSDVSDLSRSTLSRVGVVMITHPSAGMKKIVRAQVADLLEDKVNNWQELGGKDSRIRVILPGQGDMTRIAFVSFYRLDDQATRADQVLSTESDVLSAVQSTPGAFGVVSLSAASKAKKGSVDILLLANDVAPSTSNVASGKYGMVRRKSLVTSTTPNGLVVEFIRFVGSPVGQEIVAAY